MKRIIVLGIAITLTFVVAFLFFYYGVKQGSAERVRIEKETEIENRESGIVK